MDVAFVQVKQEAHPVPGVPAAALEAGESGEVRARLSPTAENKQFRQLSGQRLAGDVKWIPNSRTH
ncbi:hypothetical protein ACSNOI_21825 [Actinomadura kijaniata]|uniref:hypothetical protein n=1 Tax=Actinomadura kijaniata TaxID=46161 RepID=UPI003F1AE03B